MQGSYNPIDLVTFELRASFCGKCAQAKLLTAAEQFQCEAKQIKNNNKKMYVPQAKQVKQVFNVSTEKEKSRPVDIYSIIIIHVSI